MKVLFKSFLLFFLGILVNSQKKAFDKAMDKAIARGGDISSKRLTKMSDKCYTLYVQFRDLEQDIQRELTLNAI